MRLLVLISASPPSRTPCHLHARSFLHITEPHPTGNQGSTTTARRYAGSPATAAPSRSPTGRRENRTVSISSSTAHPHRPGRTGLSRLAAGLGAMALTAALGVATTSAASANSSGNASPHLLKPRTSHNSPAATSNLINHGGPVQTAPEGLRRLLGLDLRPQRRAALPDQVPVLRRRDVSGWAPSTSTAPARRLTRWPAPGRTPPRSRPPHRCAIQAEAAKAARPLRRRQLGQRADRGRHADRAFDLAASAPSAAPTTAQFAPIRTSPTPTCRT